MITEKDFFNIYENKVNGNITEFKTLLKWLAEHDEIYNFIKWLQREDLKI